MSHEVETMAYAKSGGLPWHGLGNPVSNKLSPKEMCEAAQILWRVKTEKLVTESGAIVTNKFGLVRESDNKVLSVVGKVYKPVQNEDAMDFFTKFCIAGKMEMETAGSLRDGLYIWGLAKVKADFSLSKADQMKTYLLMMSPHEYGKPLLFQYTAIRVVCMNTMQAAIGASLRGRPNQNVYRMPHATAFNEATKQAAEAALGLAVKQSEELADISKHLAKTKAEPKAVREYFADVLELTAEAREEILVGGDKNKTFDKLELALVKAPGQNLNTAKGTWWGALNAVTFVVDHDLGKTRDTGLSSAWLGKGAQYKKRALDLAIKAAA